MFDLLSGPMAWAFALVVKDVFTGLSTGLVDNPSGLSCTAVLREVTMKYRAVGNRYLRQAGRVLSRGRLPALLLAVSRKSTSSERFSRLRHDLALLQGLCVAWWRGEYRAINSQALLAVVAALVYFLAPLDAVPDWLLGIGLLDDLAVLAWVLRTWEDELQRYADWRDQQAPQDLVRIEKLPQESQ